MRFTVNDASQCAAAGVGTRSSNSIFDSASQTPPPRMHSAIASVGLDFSSDGAGLFPKRTEMGTLRTHFTFRVAMLPLRPPKPPPPRGHRSRHHLPRRIARTPTHGYAPRGRDRTIKACYHPSIA